MYLRNTILQQNQCFSIECTRKDLNVKMKVIIGERAALNNTNLDDVFNTPIFIGVVITLIYKLNSIVNI